MIERFKSIRNRFIACISVAALALCLANAGFFYAQIDYRLRKPELVENQTLTPTLSLREREQEFEPSRLIIPAINIDAPIVYPAHADEKVFQEYLSLGVAHYPGSAQIGEVGNAYIFGHSSDYVWKNHPYKNVFALLPKVKVGDEIFVSDSEGRGYAYIVTEKFVADADNVDVLRQDTGGKKILTLQTSYPVGSAAKRYIVRAEMDEGITNRE